MTSQGTGVNFGELGAWDTTAVSDGSYRLRLSGLDSNGYESQVLLSVQVDNTPPTAMIQRPEQMISDRWIASGQITIRGTANDQNFKGYRLELGLGHNPGSWKVLTQSATIRQSEGLYNRDTSGLEGQYTLKLVVEDFTNGQVVVNRQVTVDNTPPQAQITVPETDAIVSGNLKIVGTATDSYFDSYLLQQAEGANPEEGDWQPIEGVSATPVNSSTLRQFATTTVADGIYSLRLRVTDKVGQITTVRRTITICLLYTSPSPRDLSTSRMPSSA